MDEMKLSAMRHTAAHVFAAAVTKLFPGTKLGVGPVVENGFYYDILAPNPVSEEDFSRIEQEMRSLIDAGLPMRREEMSLAAAKDFFAERGQEFKVSLLEDLLTRGTTSLHPEESQDIDSSKPDTASVYWTGDFVDLCRGPHVENTSELGAFHLTKIAGAYWRGDEKNPQMQRVYGLVFATQEELDAHLLMLEEAKKRDHRKLGKELELFFIDDVVGKGLVMWLPNGTIVRNQIEELAKRMEASAGYQRVSTPHIAREELFLTSGHLPYYKDSMYPAMVMDDGTYYLKAMNCPHHHRLFLHRPRSYREFPIRFAEYGTCYRNELSGTLAGLLRVRALAMNDAHIYCRRDQIKDEFKSVLKLTMGYFQIFGLQDYWFRLSKWSPAHPEKYINQPENWEYAENILREVLTEMAVKFVEAEDEAAFYGPKVDVQFESIIGRQETMSTIQLDFLARERFGLSYMDEEGKQNDQVFVVHRAPLSTHERFLAFLIEQYAGAFPLWLAPEQIRVATVSEAFLPFAQELRAKLVAADLRVTLDDSDEKVGKKIRSAAMMKIPWTIVIGQKEVEGGDFRVNVFGGEEMTIPQVAFLERAREAGKMPL